MKRHLCAWGAAVVFLAAVGIVVLLIKAAPLIFVGAITVGWAVSIGYIFADTYKLGE